MPGEELAGYTFKCVGCTKRGAIFYVRFLVYFAAQTDQEFQGLHRPDGSPVFPNGMAISAHNPANARKQRVRTPSLVIIEFVLDELPNVGTAGQLLHLSLVQNYVVTPKKLHHELIFFNISGQDQPDSHAIRMAKITEKLQKGYVVSLLPFFSHTQRYIAGVLTMLL